MSVSVCDIFPVDEMDRLAVLAGQSEVVFFIGAGFSVDSEGNTAKELMKRLVVRFYTLQRELFSKLGSGGEHDGLVQLESGLRASFGIKEDVFWDSVNEAGIAWKKEKHGLNELSWNYYEANEWFCGAFEHLLRVGGEWLKEQEQKEASKKTRHQIEQQFLTSLLSRQDALLESIKKKNPKAVPVMGPMGVDLFRVGLKRSGKNDRDAGKAMFLDAMGFRDCSAGKGQSCMQGCPDASDINQVRKAYQNLLYERHWVLARMAREGWCPEVVTTNFDKLLEGAYRLAGFLHGEREHDELEQLVEKLPHTRLPCWVTVAAPTDYFRYGGSYRSAVLLKMHGCAQRYERQRNGTDKDKDRVWRRYLRSMVFTYREIQNWRDDSWSRDYLSSLLRTKTVALCCYSAQDPVVHDTFRTVYEEMAIQQGRARDFVGFSGSKKSQQNSTDDAKAPAYYFGSKSDGDKRDFHGLEVLRAATGAAGSVPQDPADHKNYLNYSFLDKSSPADGAFPNLDDHFLWLNHRVYRKFQQSCLHSELRQLLVSKCGKQPDYLLKRVIDSFKQLCENEKSTAESWSGGTPAKSRKMLNHITAWTYHFHPKLLREYACGLVMQNQKGPGGVLAEILNNEHWYYPATGNTKWTAWSVIVELAIRHMITAHPERRASLLDNDPLGVDVCRVSNIKSPTVFFQTTPRSHPSALSIYLKTPEHSDRKCNPREGTSKHIFWQLDQNDAPWPEFGKQNEFSGGSNDKYHPRYRVRMPAPDARAIWDWAAGVIGADVKSKYIDP